MHAASALLEVVSENGRDMEKEQAETRSAGREGGSPRDICLQVAARYSKRGSWQTSMGAVGFCTKCLPHDGSEILSSKPKEDFERN